MLYIQHGFFDILTLIGLCIVFSIYEIGSAVLNKHIYVVYLWKYNVQYIK